MTSHNRSQKAKTAKILTVASLMIMLLTYIVKEILEDNLKGFHDSLVSAEAQFLTELDQSTISLQIMSLQQQIESAKLETGARVLATTFSAQIPHDILERPSKLRRIWMPASIAFPALSTSFLLGRVTFEICGRKSANRFNRSTVKLGTRSSQSRNMILSVSWK